jgi:glycosyltransferase involved in cell wall biosynthesis
MKNNVIILVNSSWNAVNYRSGLISQLLQDGYKVTVVAPVDKYSDRLGKLGCKHVPISINRRSLNPIYEIITLWEVCKIIKSEDAGLILTFTIKPNIYGSLAARVLGVPVICNVSGLGYAFSRNNWLSLLAALMYRCALRHSSKVFFQNLNDLSLFVSRGIIRKEISDTVPGSGVNLQKYSIQVLPGQEKVRFLFIGRLLWDKGIKEYIEAAVLVKRRGCNAEFWILGPFDEDNRAAVGPEIVKRWVNETGVAYLGSCDNVMEYIARVDCVVLPSYREGTPRSLLEAGAMGRPIIATDVPGCRSVVDDGVNGFLCQPRDSNDLAEKILKFLCMKPSEREEMGFLGRRKVETCFDEKIVVRRYLDAIKQIQNPSF